MGKRGPKPRSARQIMDAYVLPKPNSGCWLWTGAVGSEGYGLVTLGSASRKTATRVRAHRFVWAALVGEIPAGMFLCHRCDNRLCVNPDHLFVGSHEDNMRDAAEKGRMRNPYQAGKTHCRRGHRYDETNTVWVTRRGAPARQCRLCNRENNRAHYFRHHEKELQRARAYNATRPTRRARNKDATA